MKKIIFFIIIFASVSALVGCGGGLPCSITTEKEDSYDKKVQKIFVIATVEEQLRRTSIGVFAPFTDGMASVFKLNGVEAIVRETAPESDSLLDYEKEAEMFAPDATMRVNINAFYNTSDERNQTIAGHDFEASLIDMETQKRVWYATGRVKYLQKDPVLLFWGSRSITNAEIVSAFITEVNGQKFVGHEEGAK